MALLQRMRPMLFIVIFSYDMKNVIFFYLEKSTMTLKSLQSRKRGASFMNSSGRSLRAACTNSEASR